MGTIQDLPMIVFGANMAFEGIQDLWHAARGDLDVKSVNLIKEATGHTADSVVDLTELVVSVGSAKAVKSSKTMNKAFSKASSELKSVMGEAKKVVSTVSDEAREISRAARQATRKQLAKFRRPRRTVSRIDMEGLLKERGIPSTLNKEQCAACDAAGLEMKYKPSEAEIEGVAGGMRDSTWESSKLNRRSPKGLIGHDFEDYLTKNIGGNGSFSKGGRDFDGGIGNRWWEAKSGQYWDMLQSEPQKLQRFKEDMGDRLKMARDNGATYELFSNTPIPDDIKTWLTKKGISFTELLK